MMQIFPGPAATQSIKVLTSHATTNNSGGQQWETLTEIEKLEIFLSGLQR